MHFIHWDENCSVGVPKLDNQHRVLFRIANNLYAAMMKGHSRSITADHLYELERYTREHFAAEDDQMVAANYPLLGLHRTQHQSLIRQLDEYVGRYKQGEALTNLPMRNFLNDWLVAHILTDDQAYRPWIGKVQGGETNQVTSL
jgi:hemerythrin